MKQLTTKNSEWLVRTTLYVLVRVDSLRIGPGGSAAWTPPGCRKIDSRGLFLRSPSIKVGAFSTSRSNLELDESVEDPEAADACSILLSDSLLSGQFEVSTILHVQGNVSEPNHNSVYYNK